MADKPGHVPTTGKPGEAPSSPGHTQKPGEPVQKPPQDAKKNYEEIKEAQKNITEPPDEGNVPEDADVNKKFTRDQGNVEKTGSPRTVKTAEYAGRESGPQKAERVETANPPDIGETDPSGWKGKNVYTMHDVNGETLNITPLQWEKHGQILMDNGWTEPEFAKIGKIKAGSEPIPQNIDWGKDTPSA